MKRIRLKIWEETEEALDILTAMYPDYNMQTIINLLLLSHAQAAKGELDVHNHQHNITNNSNPPDSGNS